MKRILTNLQVEWLTNIMLLSEFTSDSFTKGNVQDKLPVFIETNYPGQEETVFSDLEVLKEKGLLTMETTDSYAGPCYELIEITKKGIDYLTMLQEDFAEKVSTDSKLCDLLIQINENIEKGNQKTVLDRVEQLTTIGSNFSCLSSSVGFLWQGAIPFFVKKVLHKNPYK